MDIHARREQMVVRQLKRRGIDDAAILEAFRTVPREEFVPDDMREFAYEDGPLPIGEGQTISQPFIVACMIDAAEVSAGDRVLEVGAGSGYAAAVLSRIADYVWAIERHEKLASQARKQIERLGYENCQVIAGDGIQGYAQEAPFDVILVAARIATIPEPLKLQLAIGGRLVIPVGQADMQQLRCLTRTGEDSWESHDITPVRFVPLLEGTVPEDGSRVASDHRGRRELSLPEAIAQAAVSLPDRAEAEQAGFYGLRRGPSGCSQGKVKKEETP